MSTLTKSQYEVYNCAPYSHRWEQLFKFRSLKAAIRYAETLTGSSVVSTFDEELNETVHWRSA